MDNYEIIGTVQNYCANLAERDNGWTPADGARVAAFLNESNDPWDLFRYMDEKTGASDVGYKTRDGREWFHILRQMRNTPESGLFENLGKTTTAP